MCTCLLLARLHNTVIVTDASEVGGGYNWFVFFFFFFFFFCEQHVGHNFAHIMTKFSHVSRFVAE